ncbi:glycerol-3-phosphate dehydrogenase/oxidase [Brooklawnia cerclae]|uniref:Glycerol-3-phosphate dehydrogenase n=1 Tax=Brooklawnia cerclae TaxID=349934 RepID=A0ABX0SL54_9ACTN|nr:glycerol-3-phosphate dehydrogenase/oxidase [Brooklawnia cerclae]NIH58679.1 glycerol-3-phosphate dehydrogenase [Brooklawnia cerclae]
MGNRLNPEQRQQHLAALAEEEFDVVVIGGGVTGAGIALDAASRGLRTAIVEAQDWASGTSSRSSRLVHGGLRYLYQLDFRLVAEALHERGLLLNTLAPHLVKAQPFLWPLKTPVVERTYSAVGVGMYDALSFVQTGRSVPPQRHRTREGAVERFPDIKADSLVGAIEFYDARVDDARLVLTLVRTALEYGARAVSRTKVVSITRGPSTRVTGLVVRDLETGDETAVRTKGIINATGVWTEQTQALAAPEAGLQVLASKGIHIVVPRDRIRAQTGIFLRTEKSVLFIIPWQYYWVIGTTDTAWHEQREHPVATSEDIDYVLEQANQVLAKPLTRDDIRGTYAGLRPLLQPHRSSGAKTTKVSREHSVTRVAPGMVAIAGGKLTTYRVMARDAVDFLLGKHEARKRPSITDHTPLLGAQGLEAMANQSDRIGGIYGWNRTVMTHLLDRYGSELPELLELVDDDPGLAAPLGAAPEYLRVEVARACVAEGAQHLEDILVQRVRLNSEYRDRGAEAVDEVLEIAAPLLDWDAERCTHERENYLARVAAELAAEEEPDDRSASQARMQASDIVPTDLAGPIEG